MTLARTPHIERAPFAGDYEVSGLSLRSIHISSNAGQKVVNTFTDLFESVLSMTANTRCRHHLGRALEQFDSARLFYFLSRKKADHLSHSACILVSVFVADDHNDRGEPECWTESLTKKSCQMFS